METRQELDSATIGLGEFAGLIDFDRLEREGDVFAAAWRESEPFELLVIDNFANADAMREIEAAFPDPKKLNKSRDYVFAREKYEKNRFADIHPLMGQLHAELLSDRFSDWLKSVTGIELFVDPEFHGGGLHSGGQGSYLDMHADFNVHPLHRNWLREINILVYLNHGWMNEWGGSLKLRHAKTGVSREVEPLFNRCVIMLTKEHTLHGYDPISFPAGRFRRSVAGYGYSILSDEERIEPRSTVWKSDQSALRRAIAPVVLRLVALKNNFLGSGSSNNR